MRVAVLNRDMVNSHPGGDVVLCAQETRALARLGVERTHNPVGSLSEFDAIHCYHVNFEFARENLKRAVESGRPTVLTTIFFENPSLGIGYAEQREWLEKVSAVISHTRVEALALRLRTGYKGHIEVIHPGVAEEFFPLGMSKREGVITVNARGVLDKDSWKVRDACSDLAIPWLAATLGTHYSDLPEFYWKGKVYVFPACEESACHTVSLTVMEALAAGCRVLASKYGWGIAGIPGIQPVDPQDQEALRARIKDAYEATEWNWEPNFWAAGRTWNVVAQELKEVYERGR